MSSIDCLGRMWQSCHTHSDARHSAAQRHAAVEASQVPSTAWTNADLLTYSVQQVFTSKCWLKLGTALCPEEAIAVHLDSLVQQMVAATVVVCSMLDVSRASGCCFAWLSPSSWMFTFERDLFRRRKIWHRELWSPEESSLKTGPYFYLQGQW